LLPSNAGASRADKMTRGRLELTAIAEVLPNRRGGCRAPRNDSFARPSSLGAASRG
jgi:hypothetical protein